MTQCRLTLEEEIQTHTVTYQQTLAVQSPKHSSISTSCSAQMLLLVSYRLAAVRASVCVCVRERERDNQEHYF